MVQVTKAYSTTLNVLRKRQKKNFDELKYVSCSDILKSLKNLVTFNSYFTMWSNTNGIVCTANINSLLWYVAQYKVWFFVSSFIIKFFIHIGFIFWWKFPKILIVFWIAIGYANQRVFAIFFFSCDSTIWSIFNKNNLIRLISIYVNDILMLV